MTALSVQERAAPWLALTPAQLAARLASLPVPMRLADAIARAAPAPRRRGLTRRELEVLELAADARTVGEVAEVLGISKYTAEDHLKSARRALGVRTTREAVVLALVRGLITYREAT